MIAKSFARIHWQNLANFGILALSTGHTLLIDEVHTALATSSELTLTNTTTDERYLIRHRLSPLQVEMVLAGGQIRYWP